MNSGTKDETIWSQRFRLPLRHDHPLLQWRPWPDGSREMAMASAPVAFARSDSGESLLSVHVGPFLCVF